MYRNVLVVLLTAVFAVTAGWSADAVKYTDGKYSGTYDFIDGHGWKPQMDITVKGGKITAALFDYVNLKGELKSKDQNYAKMMVSITKKVTPAEAYAKLEKEILVKQAAGVDAVSGASESSKFFNALSAALLEKAKKGDMSKTILVMNETYSASGPADQFGYAPKLDVTFDNGKISKVHYDEYNTNKALKDSKRESAYVNTEMKKKNGIDWKTAVEKLEASLLKTQDPDKVDAVSHATEMSKSFKELTKAAISTRK